MLRSSRRSGVVAISTWLTTRQPESIDSRVPQGKNGQHNTYTARFRWVNPEKGMPHMAHSERCPICQPLTRAQAFDWIGKGYWVPVIHGNHWIRDDLDHALASLQPSDVVELNYGFGHLGTPLILSLSLSNDGVLTAAGPFGEAKTPDHVTWTWQFSNDSLLLTKIRRTLHEYVEERRYQRLHQKHVIGSAKPRRKPAVPGLPVPTSVSAPKASRVQLAAS